MEAFRSAIMEAFRDQFTATELLSYKEVLYDEATEEWYMQRDPDEVEREERNCMRLAQQFCYLFRLCALSITNTERSRISRVLSPTRVLYVRVG